MSCYNISSCYSELYSDEAHNRYEGTKLPFPSPYRRGNVQQQTVSLSQIEGRPSKCHDQANSQSKFQQANISIGQPINSAPTELPYPRQTSPMLALEASGIDLSGTGIFTLAGTDRVMFQYEPANGLVDWNSNDSTGFGNQWNNYNHQSATDNFQGDQWYTNTWNGAATHSNNPLDGSVVAPHNNHPLPDHEDGDLNVWGSPEPQENQAGFISQANENPDQTPGPDTQYTGPGFGFNEPLPADDNEDECLWGVPQPEEGPIEAASSAPSGQGEGQLQQLGEARIALPQFIQPLEGARSPSSQTNGQSQATIAESSGQGQKRKACPAEQCPTPAPTPEGHNAGALQPQRKRLRVVGKNSCECCRRSKVKCVHTPGSAKCSRCEAKGIDCVISGVDNRTNKSASDELYDVLKKNHALVQEFVAVVYLLSPRAARTDNEAHRQASSMCQRYMSPTKILDYFEKSPSAWAPVEFVRELNRYRVSFDKLEERRAAIKNAEDIGMRIMYDLWHVYYRIANGEISESDIEEILHEAKLGRFESEALQIESEGARLQAVAAVAQLYNRADPKPAPRTLGELPYYPKPE
ncbi:hypothetical protein F4781DRAFT_269427 [Annulohypoxylon bovei var. microspora]|nr:hypothetical protein F4781DRAFT_269427 [Annulohypoxylon bovei var. microspora]